MADIDSISPSFPVRKIRKHEHAKNKQQKKKKPDPESKQRKDDGKPHIDEYA